MDNKLIFLLILLLLGCKSSRQIDKSKSSSTAVESELSETTQTRKQHESIQIATIQKQIADSDTWISFEGLTSFSIDVSGTVNANADRATVYRREKTETTIRDSSQVNTQIEEQKTSSDQKESTITQSEESVSKEIKRSTVLWGVISWVIFCLIIAVVLIFLYGKFKSKWVR